MVQSLEHHESASEISVSTGVAFAEATPCLFDVTWNKTKDLERSGKWIRL